MFLIDVVIIYFIKYKLDEFELNWMTVYVYYDVVSMFLNEMVCDRDIVSSGKEILVLRLLWCVLFGDLIYLRRYPDSTGILDSHRWRLSVSEESKKVHMVMFEVEIWVYQNRTYGLTLCIWKLYSRFGIGIDQDILYPKFEI